MPFPAMLRAKQEVLGMDTKKELVERLVALMPEMAEEIACWRIPNYPGAVTGTGRAGAESLCISGGKKN